MILQLEEKSEEFLFRYWMNYSISMKENDFNFILDVNEWNGIQFGPIGGIWGYFSKRDPMPTGGAGYNLRNSPLVHYSWRFKNKSDAMLFKIKWG